MAPKNPPTREEQIVWLRHRKRDRSPHRSVRPARLVRCRIFRSARFRPACRISADYAGHISGKSPPRRDHPVVWSSSKSLSSQPTSIGRHLLWEIIRSAASAQGYARRGARCSVFENNDFRTGRCVSSSWAKRTSLSSVASLETRISCRREFHAAKVRLRSEIRDRARSLY